MSRSKIAIVGLSCRFPGSTDAFEYWGTLAGSKSEIRGIPDFRWPTEQYYSTNFEKNKSVSRWAGLVEQFEGFDPAYFGISPKEAELMDPQQRIVMELAVQCIEDAGYSTDDFRGSSTGVYIGACNYDYKEELEKHLVDIEGHLSTGTYAALIPNRISFFLDLKGPSIPIDTACSSSLVSINQAVNALKLGECEQALVGGVSYLFSHTYFVAFSQAGMLSPSGHCKAFDAGADGYVRGEGAGMVLLKPLAAALEDNDHIYGVIDSIAVNHGGKVQTITSPSAYAQARVIVAAMKKAQLSPNQISFVEVHGTGTPKGDPIEVNALKRAFSSYARERGEKLEKHYCTLSSVKTNIGHLEAASGIAGLIKVLLSMKHERIPALANFERLNPRINLEETPFNLATNTIDWPANGDRKAAVSSFGFGGVNAHAIVSEYSDHRQKTTLAIEKRTRLLLLSAKNQNSLLAYAQRLLEHIETCDDLSLDDMQYSLSRRTEHACRLAILFSDRYELLRNLSYFCAGRIAATGIYHSDDYHEAVLRNDVGADLAAVAQYWTTGNRIDWKAFFPPDQYRLLWLPPYQFNHKSYIPSEIRDKTQANNSLKRCKEREAEGNDGLISLRKDWLPMEVSQIAGDSVAPEDTLILLASESLLDVLPVGRQAYSIIPDMADVYNAKQWVEWFWKSIELIRQGVRIYNPKRCVMISTDRAPLYRTLYSALLSIDKEFQLPCCWYQVEPRGFEKIDIELYRYIDCSCEQSHARRVRFDVHSEQIIVEQERNIGESFQIPAHSQLMSDPVVLITGGAGGIGRVFAEYLSTSCNAHIILVGRTERSDGELKTLFGDKNRFSYYAADCGSTASMQAVIDKVVEEYGRIDIVLHGAGTIHDKSVFSKTFDDVHQVVAGKVIGCDVLDKVTAHLDIQRFIVLSSVTGLYGNPGQSDYAAANAYISEFVEQRNRWVADNLRSGLSSAIHWPYWRQGGMQIEQKLVDMIEDSMGMKPMSNDQGISVLNYVLNAQASQICIVPGQLANIEACLNKDFEAQTAPVKILDEPGVTGLICKVISEATGFPGNTLREDATFTSLGIDSINMQAISRDLSDALGIRITALILSNHPTINELVAYIGLELAREHSSKGQINNIQMTQPSSDDSSRRMAKVSRLTEANKPSLARTAEVAIIGLDLKISDCDDWHLAWPIFADNTVKATGYPDERWELLPDSLKEEGLKESIKGYFIEDCLTFDNRFFGISKREAMLIDPQHRLLMQSVWKAIEGSGQSTASFAQRNTAVYVCLDANDYAEVVSHDSNIDEFTAGASTPYLASNRISHYFNLEGPSETLNTACSSVYVAIEKASDLIQRGIVDQAVVCASQLNLLPARFEVLVQKQLISRNGRVAPFDKDANGFLRSEGVGCVILKRMDLARASGNQILAKVVSAASWHSGKGCSLTTPNAATHLKALHQALDKASAGPDQIAYVEAHGTASQVGDASELDALTQLIRQSDKQHTCIVSSLKSNIGHLEVCSGIASIAKAILAMRNKLVPGIAEFSEPLPELDCETIKISNRSQSLPENTDYLVGLLAYGLGGVSSCVMLQPDRDMQSAHSEIEEQCAGQKTEWLLLSAANDEALQRYACRIVEKIDHVNDERTLNDLLQTFRFSRDRLAKRAAFKAQSIGELVANLRRFLTLTKTGFDGTDILVPQTTDVSVPDRTVPGYVVNWLAGSDLDDLTNYTPMMTWPGYPFENKTLHWIATKSTKPAIT